MPSQLMPEHQNPFVPSVPVQNASIRAEFQYPLCDRKQRGCNRSQCTTPAHIGTIDKSLVCDFILIAELPQNSDCLCIRCIRLGTCLFDTESIPKHRMIGNIHFLLMIRMQCMRHIHGKQHTSIHRTIRFFLTAAKRPVDAFYHIMQ